MTSVLDEASATSLTLVLAELRYKRVELDKAILSIEAVLGPKGAESFTRSTKVREILEGDPSRAWRAGEVLHMLGEAPNDRTLRAIHQIFTRLRRRGVIARVGRGTYRIAGRAAT